MSRDQFLPLLTPEERGRLWYESGDPEDRPWEALTPAERAAWIAEAIGDTEELWVQWQPGVTQ